MKFSFKIYCIISLLSFTYLFSQIPVHKRSNKSQPKVSLQKNQPSDSRMSLRDSIQKEILTMVGEDNMEKDDLDGEEYIESQHDQIMIFRKKIDESKGLRKAVFQYYLANIYISSLTFYGRTSNKNDITPLDQLPEDYRQWAVNDFYREADRLYTNALTNKSVLQAEKTELWNEIIDRLEFAKYKPTLYDLIATNYLKFLNELPFDYDQSAKKKIASIKENLNLFHANDKDKTALLYLKSTEIEGDSKKQAKELQNLAANFPEEPFSAYLLYQAASLLQHENDENNFL
ncbi:hypothetical protein, partial [Chryseobacterium artocarpi]|uniref:hypothetical protein n=1 Tax=Chryseobacterium artocarpi TaxID=1414727 RepID=UPI003F3E55BD